MKNINKIISLFLLVVLMFSLIGCGEDPHEHKFVNGSCECGEKHNCVYINGTCECGKAHDCVYENGACDCGKVHDCVYENGACECGKVHDCEYVNGVCECGKAHDCVYENGKCSCGKIKTLETIADINDYLDNSGYIKSEYERKIEYNDVLLLKENITYEYNGELYFISIYSEKLSNDGSYEVDSSIDETKETKEITLELLEEYFDEYNIKDMKLEGSIIESYSESFIKTLGKDIKISVEINDSFKVSSICITYIDVETGFKVLLSTNYTY